MMKSNSDKFPTKKISLPTTLIKLFHKRNALKLIALLAFLVQSSFAFSQTTVKGIITDLVTGETLPYVTVTIPGTTQAVSADDDGHYSIKVPSGQTKIKFNYVGYLAL